MTATVTPDDNAKNWKIFLIAAGIVLILGAVVLQIVISTMNTETDVTTNGKVVKTVVQGTAPPAALVTTVLGFGAILFLAGAFFDRLTKIVLPGGGELDFDTQSEIAGQAAALTKGDPTATKALVAHATKTATALTAAGLGTKDSASFAKLTPDEVEKLLKRSAEDLGIHLPS